MTTPVDLSISNAPTAEQASYPIGFSLRDDDGQAVLTIADDPAEHHAHLEIRNTAGGDLQIDAPANGAAASADNYHFELRFRPGALSEASRKQLRLEEQRDWSASPPQEWEDKTISLFLLSAAGQTLAPSTPIRLRLDRISADGGSGARGTQVELRYHGLRYTDGTPLADTKLFHLDIVNQRGQKSIPLHVGFVGSNTILNDGVTANTLTLRITNISKSELRLNPKSNTAASKFIISLDADPSWGLASKSEIANKMTIEAIDGKDLDEADWDVQPGRQLGDDLAWTLTHKNADAGLAAGQVIQVVLGNITSSLPSGATNLYLRYENIPGYWDGQFVTTIEKGPIVYDERGNIGIGTAAPSAKLTVDPRGKGGIVIGDPNTSSGGYTSLSLEISDEKAGHAAIQSIQSSGSVWGDLALNPEGGNVGVGTDAPNARLTVQADSAATTEGRQIVIQGHSDAHNELALGYHTEKNYGSIQAITQGTALRPLVLNPAGGGVGIGTTDPTSTLEVNGSIKAASLEATGSIKSPMWQALKLFDNQSGPLPIRSEAFTTHGGTLVFFVSGVLTAPAGSKGINARIDAVVGSYRAYIGSCFLQSGGFSLDGVIQGCPAGQYYLWVQVDPDVPATQTNANDLFNATMLELPF